MDVLPSGMIPSVYCAETINVFGRLLSLAERRFVVTSGDCNECVAESGWILLRIPNEGKR
jgi:hypothetical protein